MTLLPTRSETMRPHWANLQPWQTNAALLVLGAALLGLTHQLLIEHDHFVIGFDAVSCGSVLVYLGAIAIFLVKPANVDRYTFPLLLGFAIIARLILLFPEAFLSTDVYRYAWDGVVQHAHINPYRYVASDQALSFLRAANDDLYSNMNRRDYAHTIYPPVAQIIFYLVTAINGSVTMMKTAMVLFEGLTVVGLLLLSKPLGVRREWTLLYLWNPLLIWEIGSSGHLDAVVMAFLTFALVFRYRRQPVLTGLFFGLAILTKFYPLVLFPALYQRRDWKMPATIVALAAITYSVYLSVGKGVLGFLNTYVQEEGIESGTRYFLLELTQHLPGLHALPNAGYVAFCGVVMGALAVYAFWRADSRNAAPDAFLSPALALAFAMMLLFSPHYPWYVAWLIPFLTFLPSPAVMTYVCYLFYLCTTGWATGSGPKQFHLNEMLYSAVAIALIMELGLRRMPQTKRWFARPGPASLPAPTSSSLPHSSPAQSAAQVFVSARSRP